MTVSVVAGCPPACCSTRLFASAIAWAGLAGSWVQCHWSDKPRCFMAVASRVALVDAGAERNPCKYRIMPHHLRKLQCAAYPLRCDDQVFFDELHCILRFSRLGF